MKVRSLGLPAFSLSCFLEGQQLFKALPQDRFRQAAEPGRQKAHPAAAPLGPCSGPAGHFCLWGLDIRQGGGKTPGVQCCWYSFVYGNKSAVTALPCGSFLLVVEELYPWGEEA